MYNNPLDPSRRGWKEEWKTKFQDEYGFDPEAAKKLLAEAGFGPNNPMKTTMVLSTATGLSASDDIAESVAAYWRSIGVDVALEQLDGPTLTSQTRAYKLLNAARVNGTSSNAWVGITQFGSTAGTPSSAGPQDPKADNLLKQIWTTLDEKKIDDLWTQAGDAMYYGHHFVPLFWLPVEAAINPAFVSDYVFGGYNSGAWTHVYNIKAAR